MRHLVLSDIHGNRFALERVLEVAPPFDRVLFLGDAVGYYPDGDWVLDVLMELKAIPILGNHDAWLLALEVLEVGGTVLEILAWQRNRLKARHLDYLRSWPWMREEDGLLLVHGSPQDPFLYLEGLEEAREAFAHTGHPLILHGHTHKAGAFLLLEGPKPWIRYQRFPEGGSLLLPPGVRALINPGSVGQPRDGVPGAAFALLEGKEVEFFRVEVDLAPLEARLKEVGFPLWLLERLKRGQ
ncbi:MAG: metallophosphoesterase family protein [Thermaceae bacterium]